MVNADTKHLMDSMDFRRTVWPDMSRDETEALLTRALLWVGKWAFPERVFDRPQLEAWALRNGFEKRDSTELVELLRQTQQYVVRGTSLSVAINDAIVARREV